MKQSNLDQIDRIFAERTLIDEAVTRGGRRALAIHKRLGQSVVVWQDGKIVTLAADEIPVGIEESENPLSHSPPNVR